MHLNRIVYYETNRKTHLPSSIRSSTTCLVDLARHDPANQQQILLLLGKVLLHILSGRRQHGDERYLDGAVGLHGLGIGEGLHGGLHIVQLLHELGVVRGQLLRPASYERLGEEGS